VDRHRGRANCRQRSVRPAADVRGKRIVSTRIHHTVTIREQTSTAALELMGRYAVDPHWLVYRTRS
jgi:protein phosphatase